HVLHALGVDLPPNLLDRGVPSRRSDELLDVGGQGAPPFPSGPSGRMRESYADGPPACHRGRRLPQRGTTTRPAETSRARPRRSSSLVLGVPDRDTTATKSRAVTRASSSAWCGASTRTPNRSAASDHVTRAGSGPR